MVEPLLPAAKPGGRPRDVNLREVLNSSPKSYGPITVKKHASGIAISDNLKLLESKNDVFNGFLEIIYKVRCMLVHGDLEPSADNHEVVKQCYALLHLFMRF